MAQAVALPGGAQIAGLGGALGPLLRQLPGLVGGAAVGGFVAGAGGDLQLFRPTMAGARAIPLVMTPNPITGAPTFFRHVGRPILFSGDVATVRRVRKIAALTRRRLGGR